jgi:hypothetical protein
MSDFRIKPKIARVRPMKTPTMIALEHFDFYYGPMFGAQWPSIRLGLISTHKSIAVLNLLSSSADKNYRLLEGLGTFELIEMLQKKKQMNRDRNRIVKSEQSSSSMNDVDRRMILAELGDDGQNANVDKEEVRAKHDVDEV